MNALVFAALDAFAERAGVAPTAEALALHSISITEEDTTSDAGCEGLPEAAMRRAEEAFITSSRWELAFWEMAWTGEKWPA